MKAKMLKLEKFPNIIQYAVYTHPYRLCIYYAIFSEKAQTKMQICPWALVWAFHIVCI